MINVTTRVSFDNEAQRLIMASPDECIIKFAEEFKAMTMRLSPYLTGTNRRSIELEAKRVPGYLMTQSGYGGWLEIGTRYRPATPYFARAFDYMRNQLGQIAADVGAKTELLAKALS